MLLGAIIFLAPAVSALAWGDDSHQTVGKIARCESQSANCRKESRRFEARRTLAKHRHLG